MSEASVLIIEDDATIARIVELELKHADYDVMCAADGATGLELMRGTPVDLVVLDLMLPEMDGLEVAREIRRTDRDLPILMLTARAETHDVVTGFEVGADDYVRKPFEMPELLSRIGALLKRARSATPAGPYEASNVRVDLEKREATLAGEPLDLTAREFDLLAYLVANAGRVISRDEILSAVWGERQGTDSNVIEVFVCHLRNKIGDRENKVIQTIRGVGYFFARG